ncbi:PhoH family protein [Thermoflexibacter ruber]|uniref:PhoH-like protein n=1 Tax=Thermoflexibacter ruber TaxID=1003 RepID=A0A1I2C8T5_9BACT|nr:PhoH family protein [Thermoflexibacter ruber]SFE64605.1 phosphate starvation-inducible protein PhoH [Thermoflexibacter ruber]
MVEKVIQLEEISLVDFLGVENANIKEIAQAFPNSKIIARGSEIRIKGNDTEIVRINEIINSLLEHYNKYSKVTLDNVQVYLHARPDQIPLHDLADDIILYGAKGTAIKPRGHNQLKLVQAIYNNDLVFALGPAGTGKTYIAVAMAVRALKNKMVKKLIITRPAVEAGENLGFLPGDLKEKIDPYLRPIYDALEDMIPSEKLKFYQEKNVIEIAPLAYMRGRTLSNAFVLLDEAQNTTQMQMKMVLTRLGEHSKMVITGDESQIDLPRNQKSGLIHAADILRDTEGIGFVRMESKDVIRHQLVKKIVMAYDKFEAQHPPHQQGKQ